MYATEELCYVVYPETIVLVRLKREMIRENAYGLTQLVLLSDSASEDAIRRVSRKRGISFWSYCETAEEVSLLMDEVSSLLLVTSDKY
jgi:hypothetical protein